MLASVRTFTVHGLLIITALAGLCRATSAANGPSKAEIRAAMQRAATYFRTHVATHGGYVYYYSPDFSRRVGEGEATVSQIWVQRPGTPAVGLACLRAWEVTQDRFYLDMAREAAEALVYGQLESGGWTNSIDFDPKGKGVAQYRGGRGRGRNFSTLDDGISQHALRLLMHTDQALKFQHAAIHEAAEFARKALLDAQFPSGGFPQVWSGKVAAHAAVQASFPDYDWRTENRIKNYWDLPTLNDDLASNVAETLQDAWEIYQDERCRAALIKFGDFLLLAQLPEPQPAWAQQYDTQMRPVWARKFEPPAIASRESLDVMRTLLRIHRLTGDDKYLEPIPRALSYLRRSRLPDGRLSRYYELQTNRPLYMTRNYTLTNDDSDLPTHYGWKVEATMDRVEAELKSGSPAKTSPVPPAQVREILTSQDRQGRWLSTYAGEMLVGQPKFRNGEPYLSSELFCENLLTLCEALQQSGK